MRRGNLAGWAMALVLVVSSLMAAPFVVRLIHRPTGQEAPVTNDGVRLEERTMPTEEIEQQIHTLHAHAEELKAEIEHNRDRDARDPIGAEIHKLLMEARSLEKELQTSTMGMPK